MNASFITFGHSSFDPKGQIPPAFYIRRSFQTDKDLVSAVLKMTALGQYIPYINGERPDNSFLNPGYTEYSVRLQVQTYDVTGLMKEGENVLAAVVGDGWWRGSCGPMGMRATYGTALALCAELTLTYENRTKVIVTDPSWKWTDDGPVRAQDIKLLEKYDARKEMPGWNCPGYDDSAWHTAKKTSYEGELIPQEGEKVLAHEHFTPEVLHTPDGSTVLDFGQNMAGIVSFSVTGNSPAFFSRISQLLARKSGTFSRSDTVLSQASETMDGIPVPNRGRYRSDDQTSADTRDLPLQTWNRYRTTERSPPASAPTSCRRTIPTNRFPALL